MIRLDSMQLGDALELAYGKNLPKSNRVGGNVPVYGSNGITGWHDTALLTEPTVIVGRKGSAGVVQYVDGPSYPIDTTYFVRPRNGHEFEMRFVYYLLRNLNLPRLATATGVPGLTREDAYRETIRVPRIKEQHRIVDLLSRAEGIVQLRRDAQKKAAELLPALFLAKFGNPATNPKSWPTVPFGELGQLDRGKSRHRPRDAQELYGGPYPFIQTGDVANSGGCITRYGQTYSELGLAQSRLWPAETLCITIAANIARTGVLGFDACFPDSVVGFTPSDAVTVDYIQLQPTLEKNAPQAAQKNINLNILRNLPVPVPPIALQRQFGNKADAVRSIVAQQANAMATAHCTFDALLNQSFQPER